jgi:integrase
MPGLLRDLLVDHRMRCREPGQRALVFGQSEDEPFHAATLYRRADKAWKNAELAERLRFHQARHTYASFMIAANVNAKALSAFMGHSSIKVTFDLYGHLMPGSEAEAAALLDAYLSAERERAEDRARAAGEGLTGAQTGAQVVRGG